MKKRLISLLLTVVMLMSLCTVLGASASAAANVTTVTIASGDNLVSICQKLGVDFYTYKNLIMNLNGFTSESQLSKISVGQQIVLPSSAAAAATLAGSSATAATLAATTTTTTAATTTAAAATGSTLTTGQVTSIPAGDRVAYYLVNYTIQKGETIQGIYSNWGLSYKTYDSQIKKLNGITSYNSIAAGKTMLLPTTNPGVASSSYYTVMAHTMLSGESAYDIICNSYGMNYSANQNMILALNNTTDLSRINAGTALYIPVSGVVSPTSAVSTTTAATTTTATISAGGVYNLVSQTAVNGSFDLQVDGYSVTTASAGKTVKVVTAPAFGYAVDTIKVTKVGDSNSTVGVSNGYFTMPSYSVIVAVTFKTAKAYNVDVAKTSNGSATAMVSGIQVSKAYVGNTVTVKTIPDTSFMLDYVRVTYNDGKDSIAVYNNTFTMPDTDVEIIAVFEKDPNYDPKLGHAIYTSAEYGTVETYVGNEETEYANAGDRVSVDVTPFDNYVVDSVTVYYDNFKKTADIDKGSFTMPDAPVTIVATIKPMATATFSITKIDTPKGEFAAYIGEDEVTEAKIGEEVYIYGEPVSSAYWYVVTVYKTGDTTVTVPVTTHSDGSSSFEMPAFPVSVQCKFYLYHHVYLDESNGTYGTFGVYAGNTKVSKCASGVELTVAAGGIKSGYTAANVILTYADGSSYTLSGASFIMPDCDVKVKVNFTKSQSVAAHAATMDGKYGTYGNTYTVGTKTMNGNKAAVSYINVGIGHNVKVYTYPEFGYEVARIWYEYTNAYGINKTEDVDWNYAEERYQFEMPELYEDTSLHLYVDFTEIKTYEIKLDYEADNNKAHNKGTFAVTMLSHSAYVDHAVEGRKAQIHCYPADGYAVDSLNVKVYNQTDGSEVEINRNDYTFTMPAAPVRVVVPFYETSHYIQLLRSNDGADGKAKGILSVIIDGVEYIDSDLVGKTEYDYDYSNVRIKFPIGTLVTVINRSRDGYVLDSSNPIVINKVVDGSPVNYKTIDGDHFSFEMPNADVVISAQYLDDMVSINALEADHGSYKVPAQVAWNGSFTVTEIVPEEGYELDKIVVSYVDHFGEYVDKELVGTTVDLSNQKGMLQSDINVEVFFKAAVNPMTIKYIFDDSPDKNSNYKVDLTVDGKTVEGIERSYDLTKPDKPEKYADRLNKVDSKGNLTGYGILTGKTVVISRNESKMDKNFEIVNIWVTLNNGSSEPVAIKPEFSNNQYYFKMPYVSSGSSDDLTLYIEYAKFDSDAYNLSTYKADGDGEISSWQFTVDGTNTNKATASSKNVALEIIVPEYCEIVNNEVTVRYTDSDGVVHPTEAEKDKTLSLTDMGGGKWQASFSNTDGIYPDINSMPLNKSVTLDYKVERKAYALADMIEDEIGTKVGTPAYTVEGAEVTLPDSVKWGKTVTMTVTPETGLILSNIQVIEKTSGNEVSVSKGTTSVYQFVMPKDEIVVKATAESSASTVKIDNSACSNIHALIYVNGSTFTDQVAVAEGTDVLFMFDAPENYTVTLASLKEGAVDVPNTVADGIYSFKMPAGSVVITPNAVESKYTMRVVFDTEGITGGIDYTVKEDGTELTSYTPSADYGRTYSDIKYGPVYSIIPPAASGEVEYALVGATVSYIDVDGNEIYDNATIGEDGYAYIYFDYVPKNGTEIVVRPTFVKNPDTVYSITWDEGIGNAYELTYNITDADYLYGGSTVLLTMSIKYYKTLNEDNVNDFLKLTYNVGGTLHTIPIYDFYVYDLDGNGQSYKCTCKFLMPSADVTVTVDPTKLGDEKYVELASGSDKVYDSTQSTLDWYKLNGTYYVYAEGVTDKNAAGSTVTVSISYATEKGAYIEDYRPAVTLKKIGDYYYGEFKLGRSDESSVVPMWYQMTVVSTVTLPSE